MSFFQKAVFEIPISKLGIGLQTLPMDNTTLSQRFTAIEKYAVQEIDIWDAPIPKSWFPYLNAFVQKIT